MVASAAALLLQAGDNAGLSNGTINLERRGTTIHHAQTSEVIKSVLMAGADRYGMAQAYTIDSSNNLDSHYGAGQLNIFNSYNILAAGERNSSQDGGGAGRIRQ